MKELVRKIREKHDQINGMMNRFLSYETNFSNATFKGVGIPFKKLEKAGVPQPILDHLRHESLAQIMAESEARKAITKKINQALDRLEENPQANKRDVISILELFKEAEDSIVKSHNAPNNETIYQKVFDVTAAASAAINMLKENRQLKPTPLLEEAQNEIDGIREYCRHAHDRHALWVDQRLELKNMVAELGSRLGVKVDKKLLSIPDVYNDIYISINAKDSKIESDARKLLKQI